MTERAPLSEVTTTSPVSTIHGFNYRYPEPDRIDRRANAPESWWADPVVQATHTAFSTRMRAEFGRMRENEDIVPLQLNLT